MVQKVAQMAQNNDLNPRIAQESHQVAQIVQNYVN